MEEAAKHSQGPWEAWIGGKSRLSVTGPAAAAVMCCRFALRDDPVSKGEPWVEVAATDQTAPALVFGDTQEQCEANARLIAAAPDLLEALQRLAKLIPVAARGGVLGRGVARAVRRHSSGLCSHRQGHRRAAMSALLEAAATLDPQRAADLAATDAIYAPGDLTLEDLAELDAAYHQKKVSGGLRARDDAQAQAFDLAHLDAMRRAGW
jgi:hypothetical protein